MSLPSHPLRRGAGCDRRGGPRRHSEGGAPPRPARRARGDLRGRAARGSPRRLRTAGRAPLAARARHPSPVRRGSLRSPRRRRGARAHRGACLLGLELTGPGFDASVLSEPKRSARGRRRRDAAPRHPSRRGPGAGGLAQARTAARRAPPRFWTRCGRRAASSAPSPRPAGRAPGPTRPGRIAARRALAERAGRDEHALLAAIMAPDAPRGRAGGPPPWRCGGGLGAGLHLDEEARGTPAANRSAVRWRRRAGGARPRSSWRPPPATRTGPTPRRARRPPGSGARSTSRRPAKASGRPRSPMPRRPLDPSRTVPPLLPSVRRRPRRVSRQAVASPVPATSTPTSPWPASAITGTARVGPGPGDQWQGRDGQGLRARGSRPRPGPAGRALSRGP